MHAIAGTDGSTNDLDPDEKKLRERQRRSKGLERFILALSDQQLVTGLAILIAGYTNRCTMSLHHFNIVASLAWFSSTTHLSTLAVLRIYLMDRPKIRDWRVAAMLSLLGLLLTAQFAQYSLNTFDRPLQCAFQRFATIDYYNPQYIQNFISLALIILFLLVTYGDRIGRLYSDDPDWSVQGWIIESIVRRFATRKVSTNLERICMASSRRSRPEQSAAFRKLRQRRRLKNYATRQGKGGRYSPRWLLQLALLKEMISQAFLSDLMTLLFGFVFGVTRIIVSRKSQGYNVVGDEDKINFGQVVPLLLLALPILAAGEAYFEQAPESPPEKLSHKHGWIVSVDQTSYLTERSGFAALSAGLSRSERAQWSPTTFGVNPASENVRLLRNRSDTNPSFLLHPLYRSEDGSREPSTTVDVDSYPWERMGIETDVEVGAGPAERSPSTGYESGFGNSLRDVSTFEEARTGEPETNPGQYHSIWTPLIGLLLVETSFRALLAVILGGGLLVGFDYQVGYLSLFVAFISAIFFVFINLVMTAVSKTRELRAI
ncbi:hypothetical protein ACLMJK_007065 [Lecanora helva]